MVGNPMRWLFLNKELLLRLRKTCDMSSGIKQGTKLFNKNPLFTREDKGDREGISALIK